jgi:hypothetical protein
MNVEKITYTEAPKDIAKSLRRAKVIPDFLPPPEKLVLKEPKVKITISLNSRSVDFFKKHAKKNNTGYPVLINEVLDRYASNYG